MKASVCLDLKGGKTFDYAIPEELQSRIEIGSFVEVPLKSTLKKGTVLKIHQEPSPFTLKPIRQILGEEPILSKELLKLALWISSYYCTPLGSVLPAFIPSSVRKGKEHKEQYMVFRCKTKQELIKDLALIRKKSPAQSEILDFMLRVQGGELLTVVLEKTGASRSAVESLVKKELLRIEKVKIDRSPLINEEYVPSKPKQLTAEQKESLQKIEKSLSENIFQTHLLFGITGSGKTEVYLQAIQKALDLQKGTVLLVPEIALTSQTIERFRSRFEGHIAVLHHRLSEGERLDEWKKIQKGEAKIVIGARSAIFCPIQNLGLIIVDEEHEASYKQSDTYPAYHARDVAVMRGHFTNASVVLGSATPSLESTYNAKTNKYSLSILNSRPETAKLPTVTVIDMKPEYDKKKGLTLFSEALLSGIEKRLKKGEQTLLFLNRRGYHSLMLCKTCGETVKCPDCDLSLTFHKKDECLLCHMCGYEMAPPPSSCPKCKAQDPLKFRGAGTQQAESALLAIFPDIRILRLDADTTKHKGSHQKIYRAFRTGKADLLIGTQMIAKGLHFPEVTLVGILNSDVSLNIPDFRASETTFQLITQVAGRAGRGTLPGEVIIQTSIPENSVIGHAAKQDYPSFYEEEIEIRKTFRYPPFTGLAKLRFTGKDLLKTQGAAETLRLHLMRYLPPDYEASIVDAPAHAKIKTEYRFHFLIKGPKISVIANAIRQTQGQIKPPSGVRLFIDINPSSTYF
jgi:primosomal protein N' (replication factor Y) (superfamily II helicase)